MRRWWRERRARGGASLGVQLVLLLTGVGVAGALAITVLLAAVITPNFNQLERRAVLGHVERARAALAEYAGKVESAVRDYGDWNTSYDYMAAPDATFERESFSPLAMANLGISGMAYVGNDRRIVIARWLDQASGVERPDARRRFAAAIRGLDLAGLLRRGSSTAFYVRLGGEVAAVGLARIRRSDGTGDPRGYVLMARPITSQQLSALLQINARIDLAASATAPSVTRERSRMVIAVPIAGEGGRSVATARFAVPRDVSVLGRRMLLLAVAGSTLLLLLVLLVLRRAIARLVLAPLGRVEHHMQHVRASGGLATLADEVRRDEIGSLGRSFNAMLRQLKDLREQVEVQSFALGRSESAVAVMHNVRNGLNPVSTILSQGAATPPPIDRRLVNRAVAELARDDVPAARRQKLAGFVAAAVEAQAQARARQINELQVGRAAMADVLEIISQQQGRAHERPELEECDVTDIVARHAIIARYADGASIAFTFPATPHLVLANRVILSQVVGNLIGNAGEAIAASGRNSGSISVIIEEMDDHVRVCVTDDGEGFDPQAAPSLFQRGFSTRQHKSGGLGLHWCANSMVAMEGSLKLESEGPGRGATATLTLKAPVPPEQRAAA